MSMNVGDSTDLIHGGGGGIRVFWLSRTNMEKGLLITVGVMTLLIIGLFVGVGVLAGKANEASSNPQPAPEVPTPLPEATDPSSQAPTTKATHANPRRHISPPHTHLPTTTTHPNPRPHISPTHPPTHSPTSATHPQTHTSPPHTHPPITTSHSQTHTSPPHIQSTIQLPSVANMPSRAHG